MLLSVSFAAGHHKSYWNGCIKVALVICQQIFPLLALVMFLINFCQNRLIFALAPRPSFGAAISGIVVRKGLCV